MIRAFRIIAMALAVLPAVLACKPRQAPAPSGGPSEPTTTTVARPDQPPDDAAIRAAYGRRSLPDLFNRDLTDEKRRTAKARSGGQIVIRVPSELKTLNPVLGTAEMERLVEVLVMDALMVRDGETFEQLPKAAAYYIARDYIERRDGTRIEGLVTAHDDRGVTIVPGAGVWTFLRADLVSSDTTAGVYRARWGQELRGAVKEYEYTVLIEERPSTPPITLAIDELSTWTNPIGGREEVRPSIKRRCVFEFRLRPGIRWQDGQPVTMRDAKTWFDSMRNEYVDAAHLRFLYLDVEKMEVPDPMTAKFIFSKPYYKSLDVCGAVEFLPTHILRPEDYAGDPEGYGNYFNKHPMGMPGTDQFVGMGPYLVERWDSGRQIVLVRNPDYWARSGELPYWDRERPYLERIVYRVIADTTPALRELENGAVDADFDIEPDTWVMAQTNAPAFTSRYARANPRASLYTYIGWNNERVLFREPTVRRALTMLLPRESILANVHHGLGTLAVSPNPPGDPWSDPTIQPTPYDPQEARRLLREARWIDRDGDGILDRDGVKFEFEYQFHTSREYHAKIADIVRQSLGQAGIQVNLRRVDFNILGDNIKDHAFDAFRMAWGGVVDPDPYQIWHSTQSKGRGSNYVSYKNPLVDERIEQLREEFDTEKRWALMREVDRLISEDQPYTFMFVFESLAYYSKKFRGVKFYRYAPNYDLTEWWSE